MEFAAPGAQLEFPEEIAWAFRAQTINLAARKAGEFPKIGQ
ncbi:hypothetical protein [Sphingobium sp. TB-6]|nr:MULTISPECIES: hypothetical protein [Sphingomonadaceae]